MLDKVKAYFEWGLNDTRIAGYVPWHFNTRWNDPQWVGPCDMILGAVEMPSVIEALQDMGTYIRNRNQ